MPREDRKRAITEIQEARDGRLLISYITSTRQGLDVQMADDALRLFYSHLDGNAESAKRGVDLFIHSNGGQGTVPWRLVSLIREYTKQFAVLVPHRAFSAATLVALGADEIIMHRMGCLGPIDPSVANGFNPPHPQVPGQLIPISVEDVSAFFKLVKDEVGINHEEELVQTINALTDKIHPLALGNVQRSHNQAKMMAKKLLKTHIEQEKEHTIEPIVENLKSNLFYHGHPINRNEAENDLNLKVKPAGEGLEKLMWALFAQYEDEMKLNEPFNLYREWELGQASSPVPPPPTTAAIMAQLIPIFQAGLNFTNATAGQLADLADAIHRHTAAPVAGPTEVRLRGVLGAIIESELKADMLKSDMLVDRISMQSPTGGPQKLNRCEVIWQRWEEEQ